MTIFDLIIVGIFLISIVVGIMRGFMKEVLSLITWIGAFFLAITFGAEVGQYLSQLVGITTPMFIEWGGRVVVFIGTLFIGAIITYILIKMLKHKAVRGVDRMLGIFTGAIRAVAIVVSIIIFAGRGFSLENSGWWKESTLVSHFYPISSQVENLLPEGWQSNKDEEADGDDENLQDTLIKSAIDKVQSKLDGDDTQ